MAYNYEADRLRKVQEMMMRRNNMTPDGIKILQDDPDLNKNNRMAGPLKDTILIPEGNSPVIDTSNPNVGFGEKGNIFPGGPFERKALMKMYGGTGSENAKRALAEDNRLAKEPASKGKIGPASQLARGQAEFNIAKRQRLNKQMNMQDPSDYYNPPQKQVSLGQLLGK